MTDDGTRDLANRLGLRPVGEKRRDLPVDPQIWRKAHEAHASEETSIYARLIKRKIDHDEAKRRLSEVREKVKVTYFALIKAEHNE